MADGAIVEPTTTAAPKDYTLTGSQEIVLKSVRAVIDGSGAGSAFLPALQLLDPNGNVAWEGTTSDAVAAGGSADVSWFPGLGAQAASGSGADVVMPYATASIGSWSWAVGSTHVDFTGGSCSVSDTSVYTNNLATDGSTPIIINKAGIYIGWCGVGPWNPAWGNQAELSNMGPDFGSWAGMGNAADNYPVTFTPVGGITGASPALLMFSGLIAPTDPNAQVRMGVNQNSGATRNVGAAIKIIRLTSNGVGA